ncbi:MAG: acyl-CoA thioesterase [Rhodocyclaceae bacterium]|nr:acyl-CoA thioesterase [Rhodocyclaceae bacterium]
MKFITTRTILFGDCDPAGIIFTPRIAYFVVEAVHDFLTHILKGPAVREIFAMDVLPPARAMSIEFLAPMAWDDVIDIEVSCDEPRNSSFTFHVVGRNRAGASTFKSTFTQVCVSPQSKQPITVPEALRRALSDSRLA